MRNVALSLLFALLLAWQPMTAKELKQYADLSDPSEDALESKLKGPIAPSPEDELPVRPKDLRNKTIRKEVERIYKDSGDIKLKGEAKSGGVFSNATIIRNSPLSRYKGDNLIFYKVTVKNQSGKPMLLLGSQSSLNLSAIKKRDMANKSVDALSLEAHDNNLLTPGKKAAVGLVSLGSAGFFGPLTYEYLTPSEHRKRNLGIALGRDRGRHEVEGERLGLRLIMPGGDTTGWVAFKNAQALTSSSKIYVPVMYPPYKVVKEVLSIPMGQNPQESALNSIDDSNKNAK